MFSLFFFFFFKQKTAYEMRISGWSSDVCSSDLPLPKSDFVTTLGLRFQKEIPMAVSDTYVRARIDNTTKERATAALGAMGLSISDAIRLLMLRIADERRLPFEVKVPNAATREAMAELAAGKGTKDRQRTRLNSSH